MDWTLSWGGERFVIRAGPAPEADWQPARSDGASGDWERDLRRFTADADNARSLSLIHAEHFALADDPVIDLAHALAAGRLVLYRLPARGPVGFVTNRRERSEERPEREPEPHEWIEIELVDEEGAPVANAPVELEMPDGSKRRGVTNAVGKWRIDRIPGGQCRARFPSYSVRQ
jgi:hypothetical protein